MKISHPDYLDYKLIVSISIGEIRKNYGEYFVRVNKPGVAFLTVSTSDIGLKEIAKFGLQVKLLTPELAKEFKN